MKHRFESPLGRPARRGLLALLASLCLIGRADAQPGVVRLVVAYPPGGSNDVAARILAPRLGAELGANVIIDNRAGANGSVGADAVAKAPADGSTLLLISASPLVIVPHVMARTPYETLRDFAPVNQVAQTPEAIGVHPALGIASLGQLLERAKTEDVRISSSGNGGMPHLTIELLKAASKGRIIHVPYKGGGPAVADAVAGHVEAVVMDLSALQQQFKGGKLKPLAVTSARRDDFLPEVPTARELGLPSVDAANWIGMFAPARTPAATIARLNKALLKVLALPEVVAQLQAAALTPVSQASPAAFAGFVAREHARWGRVVRETGVSNE